MGGRDAYLGGRRETPEVFKRKKTLRCFDDARVVMSAMDGIIAFLRTEEIPHRSYSELPSPDSEIEEIFLINPCPNSNLDQIRQCVTSHPQTRFYIITPFSLMRDEISGGIGNFKNLSYVTVRDHDRLAKLFGEER